MDTRVHPSPNLQRDEIRLKDLVEWLVHYRLRVMLFVLVARWWSPSCRSSSRRNTTPP